MDRDKYFWMVEIHGYPLPAGFAHRYHYFRQMGDARDFSQTIKTGYTIHAKRDGCSFTKPVAMPILELDGNYYEIVVEFNYEALRSEVFDAFQKHNLYGCDCARCDLLLRSPEYFDSAGAKTNMPCGSKISLQALYIAFRSTPSEIELH